MKILIRKNILYGGAELLIERLAKAYVSEGEKTLVVCHTLSETMRTRFSNNNIKVLEFKEWYDILSWKDFWSQHVKDSVLTFWIHDFIFIDMMRSLLNSEFYLIHYVITSDDLIVGKSIKNPILKKLFHSYYMKFTKKLHYSGACVYMDEESVELPENYYDIKLVNPLILRLPYICHECIIHNQEKFIDGKFTILTICRADLYMKGYLIGLIEGFGEYLKQHDNAYLEIVTFGEDIDKIRNKIKLVDKNCQSHIFLHGKMEYEQLNEVWNKASVYVGMGTTILDAADKGVIPIPVMAYTERFYSQGLFAEAPEKITAFYQTKQSGYDVIERVYNMDTKTYNHNRLLSNQALKNNYDVYTTIHKIDSLPVLSKPIKKWTWTELLIEKVFLLKDDKKNLIKLKNI